MDSTDHVVTYQVEFEELRKGTFEKYMMGYLRVLPRSKGGMLQDCQCVWWCSRRYKADQVLPALSWAPRAMYFRSRSYCECLPA